MASSSILNQSKPADSRNFTDLELALSLNLLKLKPNENSFFSTYSIIQAIGLLLLNNKDPNNLPFSKVNWATILQNSEKDLSSIEKVTLKIANVIYADNTLVLKETIFELIESLKNGKIENLDFLNNHKNSRLHINKFVEGETNGLIKDLLGAGVIDQDTRSILINCIYFYGSWKTPFNEYSLIKDRITHDYPWMGNSKKKFKIMYQENEDVKMLRNQKGHDKHLEMLRLPYTDQIGFYVILDRLAETEQAAYKSLVNSNILGSKFKSFRSQLRSYDEKIKVYLPKFEVECSFDSLKETIEMLGFPMTNDDLAHEPLIVDEIIHKAVCKVDEKGTEAAAATSDMLYCAMPRFTEPPFIVDRPFLYLIYDDINEKIMFSGYFHEPDYLKKKNLFKTLFTTENCLKLITKI